MRFEICYSQEEISRLSKPFRKLNYDIGSAEEDIAQMSSRNLVT